jgi:hypothetical protein
MIVVDFASQTQQATQAYAQMGGPAASAQKDAKPARQKVAKRRIHRPRDLAPVPDEWSRDRYTGVAFAPRFPW